MTPDDWSTAWAKSIGVYVNGSRLQDPDDDFYLAFNSHSGPLKFTIPCQLGRRWRVALQTADHEVVIARSKKGSAFCVEGHSALVLVRS